MKFTRTNKRKAISPVLATVILIAITLVAGVAIAGFAFGLFGSLSSTANVTVTSVTCSHTNDLCTLSLSNTGSAPATITGCSIYGVSASAVLGTVIGAGLAGISSFCQTNGGTYTAGTALNGQVTLSSGIQVGFAGTWT
jgi:flagellin-like protein